MQKVIEILQNSGVILTPTDTTFGLSCLAFDRKACEKINQIKNRPKHKNFVLLVDNDARLERYVEVPDLAWDIIDLAEKPVTIVYELTKDLPNHVLSADGSVAIRLVKMPVLQKIMQQVKQPLVSTSVNFSGENTPQKFEDISSQILEQVDYVLPETNDFQPHYSGSSIIQVSMDGKVKVIRV